LGKKKKIFLENGLLVYISYSENAAGVKKVQKYFAFIVRICIGIVFLFSYGLYNGLTADGPETIPQRIVSLAPHITEIIFKLGAGNRLVGRTDFCRYPPAAQKVPSLGGYLNVDFEKLVATKPDLVFQFPNAENRRKIEAFGITVEEIPNETIEEILDGISKVGRVLGLESKAEKVRQNILDTLSMVAEISKNFFYRPSALLLVGRVQGSLNGLYAAGTNTYLGEIWKKCGGRNAFSDVSMRYFSVNKEYLLSRQIDVIVEFRSEKNWDRDTLLREKTLWQQMPWINAVKYQNIFIFTDSFFLIPGPRISQIAVEFSQIIQNVTQKNH